MPDKSPDEKPTVDADDVAETDAVETDTAEVDAVESDDADTAVVDDAALDDEAGGDDADEVVVKARKRPASKAVDDADDSDGAAATRSAGAVKASAAKGASGSKQITLSVRTLVLSLVGLLVGAGLLFGVIDNLRVRSQLNELREEKANAAKAEQVASDYAVKAATLDYKDLTPWAANLKKGVSPQLAKQFEVAVPAMSQILTPVRMSTTATLVSATTTDVVGDIYRVTAVVEVTTKSLQTPNGATSLAAYVLTLNKAEDWQITAVGDQAVPGGAPGLPGVPGQQNTTPAPSPAPAPAPSPAPAPAPGG